MLARPVRSRKADEELHATQERLALALEATGLSVWDWDIPSGALTFVPSLTSLLGYPDCDTPQDNEGRDLMHPDDLAAFDAAYQAHVRGEAPRLDCEFRMKHFDGSWRWIHSRGEIVARAHDGAPTRVVGTFADVTERHQEAADRQFLTDLTVSMVETADPASIVNVAIQKLAKHLMAERVGVSELNDTRDMFITRAVWSHKSLPVPPTNHRTAYDQQMIDAACAGPIVIEDMQTDPLGAHPDTADLYRQMDIRAVLNIPLQAPGRNPFFLFVHARDPRAWTPREIDLVQQVAERLWNAVGRARAEDVRQSSDELLTMALNAARLGAFERNIQTGHIRVSDGFFELLGHPDLSSGTLTDYVSIVHPADRARFVARVANARVQDKDYELNDAHRIVTSTGEVRHVLYRSRTHYEPDAKGIKRLVRAAAIIQDVTDEKRQAEEAAQAREKLYRMGRVTAMGTMASTLAHELNQPLAAAANYMNALRAIDAKGGSAPGVDRAEVLKLAAQSVSRAGEIIKKIRRFTGAAVLERQPESVSGLVRMAMRGLKDQFGDAMPTILKHIPDGLTVRVDALQIEQVLLHLLRNAADALAGRKDGRITLAAVETEASVLLSIADNGPGIPDDRAGELFSPFRSSKRDGVGLGLSLCRTMVETHGGHLTLEKHDSSGCIFIVQLPRIPATAATKRG